MDRDLLVARVEDLKTISYKTNAPKFMGFLTPDETAILSKQFSCSEKHSFFGGYDGAERTVLGVLPDWCEDLDFPIKAVTITYRTCDLLSHRDFLGALIALGIKRESVGDILIEKGRAVVFLLDDVFKFVITQINKVGNVGVELKEGFCTPLPQMGVKQTLSATVASMRIDCVVAAICNISRGQASQKIADSLVLINSVCVVKSTVNINPGDKITIRKRGKFEIVSCDGYSKSGRIILKYNKYA